MLQRLKGHVWGGNDENIEFRWTKIYGSGIQVSHKSKHNAHHVKLKKKDH
jgi:hypothetical protein